jgi:hypothetical protein
MQTPIQSGPHWSTASFGDTADTSPMELSALGDHLDLCRDLRGRLFAARCRAVALGAVVLGMTGWRVL